MPDEDDVDSLSQRIDPASDPDWDTYTAAQVRLAALSKAQKARQDARTPAARRQAAQQAQRIAQIQRVLAARKKASHYQAEQGKRDTGGIVRPPSAHPVESSSTSADAFASRLTDDITNVDQLDDLLRELKRQDPALYESLDIEDLNGDDTEAIMRGFDGAADGNDANDDGQPQTFDTLRGQPRSETPRPARASNWQKMPDATPSPSGRPPSTQDSAQTRTLINLVSGAGFTLVVFIVGGYFLDQALKTSPTFILIGLGLGIFTILAIFIQIYRVLAQPRK